jgi:2-keto-3-deoxy-L-rhamnonate aldolase RhmA
MNGIELKKALHDGQYVFGTLITSASPIWLRVVKKLDIDFVFIDTEHVPLDRETVANMCQMYNAIGVAPVVRIPSPDPYLACEMIDGGACGVIAPYVETVEQVKALCGAVKWRPLKGKILQEWLEGKRVLKDDLKAYLSNLNRSNLLIINIESIPAMENLDYIVTVPGVDALLVGPHDLSISLGVPEQYDSLVFRDAIRLIAKKGRAAGLGVGNHFSYGIEPQIAWAREGVNIIINNSDINAFYNSMIQDLTSIKQALGIDAKAAETTIEI